MTWAVVNGDESWADLDELTPEERGAVDDLLSASITSGPPQDRLRVVAGVTLFEHHVEDRVAVTYFVNDDQRLIGVLRVRRL
ncbi:MAG: hypothetical protein M3256_24795 [Actinomycetota bacterium]|nr:hypothetical protein [Actinomycetota bacterium]